SVVEGPEVILVLFKGRGPLVRLHVNDRDVLISAAYEVGFELISLIVLADREAAFRSRIDVTEVVVSQAEELLLGNPVFGKIAVGFVPLLLDLLL
ncbi:MAG: hypothetical protein ACXWFO_09660, partial [Candidatus Aminicenantales bacterium]